MALDDKEIWAAALHVERQYREDAPLFIAERIGAMAIAGDIKGVATWKAIATKLAQARALASKNKN